MAPLTMPTAVANNPANTLLAYYPSTPTITVQFVSCDPTNGNYFTATGRDLVTFVCLPAADAPGWSATLNYTAGQVVNFPGESDTITNVAITTNVLTVSAINTFTVGVPVTLAGLTTATFLNGQIVIVTATTGSNFTATFAHADYASAPDTGTADNVADGSFIAIAASGPGNTSARQPGTVAYWAVYTNTSPTLDVFSAPDGCTGRTANIVDYDVPVFCTTIPLGQAIEFLVLPSSVFTQASGQVQFQASSNLVYVLVRSL